MMTNKDHVEIDRKSILTKDGVKENFMDDFNREIVSVPDIINKNGRSSSWSHTLVNTESNSATLIAQISGEGNRLHYHPDWNEWWYILEGEWEWEIEGSTKVIRTGDVVFMQKGRHHKITARGEKMAIRLAVSRADVEHVYPSETNE
jgi:quercetin dioxygenase-like cupin family protein